MHGIILAADTFVVRERNA